MAVVELDKRIKCSAFVVLATKVDAFTSLGCLSNLAVSKSNVLVNSVGVIGAERVVRSIVDVDAIKNNVRAIYLNNHAVKI
jgi:hypothetical protein